jgi:HTH-type transcriptional regulator/antitoxin HigA
MSTVTVPVIRTSDDLDEATKRIAALWGAAAGTNEGDELDALIAIVHAYESLHYPMLPPSPVEAVRFATDQRGHSQCDLSRILGSAARVSEFLSGKRSLSKAQVVALHREYRIPCETLLGLS